MLYFNVITSLLAVPLLPAFAITGIWEGQTHIDYQSTTCAVPLCEEEPGVREVEFSNGGIRYHASFLPLKTSRSGTLYAEITVKSLNGGNIVQTETLATVVVLSEEFIRVSDSKRVMLLDSEGHDLFSCTCTHVGAYSRRR